MSVYKASMEDVKEILFVINRSNAEAYREIIPPEYFKEPILTFDGLLEDFKKMTFYVYKLEDRIVGVSALEPENSETGRIRWVYVLPEHQRKGVGTSLIRYIEDEARKSGLRKLWLVAGEKAHWAVSFYTKLRYKVVGKREKPWDNELIFEKVPP